jgi:hypothetical protein
VLDYVGVRKFVTVRIDDGHDVPVHVVYQVRMSSVVLNQFADDPGDHSGTDPFTSVNT